MVVVPTSTQPVAICLKGDFAYTEMASALKVPRYNDQGGVVKTLYSRPGSGVHSAAAGVIYVWLVYHRAIRCSGRGENQEF